MNGGMYGSGEYVDKNPSWHSEDSEWKAGQILKMMDRNRLLPNSMCEVGCGAGEILNGLHNRMPKHVVFSGYEISPQAFDICRQKEKERLKYYRGNMLESETPYSDIALAIDVFEHVEDYRGFLRQLRLKAAHKIFHIPLDLSVSSVLRGSPLANARKRVGHIHYFTKETAIETLKDTGYEILDHFYTAGSIDLPSKSLAASLARLPRQMIYRLHPDTAVRWLGGYSLMVLAR